MRKILFTISTSLLLCSAGFGQENSIQLFNGKDLDGWVQRGGKAIYKVDNGEIVGTAVAGTPNSFLCTKENYGNFILELEFKVDSRLNSGVQFRSQCYDQPTVLKGLDGQPLKNSKGEAREVKANVVHGYQCEIDFATPKNRFWTAGIYEEGIRNWLYPGSLGGDAKAFTEQGGKLTKLNEWNQLKIQAQGTSIKTWLNGEPRASIEDALNSSGLIGLQVHAVSKELAGSQVRFRKIRLQPLGAAPSAAAGSKQ